MCHNVAQITLRCGCCYMVCSCTASRSSSTFTMNLLSKQETFNAKKKKGTFIFLQSILLIQTKSSLHHGMASDCLL